MQHEVRVMDDDVGLHHSNKLKCRTTMVCVPVGLLTREGRGMPLRSCQGSIYTIVATDMDPTNVFKL